MFKVIVILVVAVAVVSSDDDDFDPASLLANEKVAKKYFPRECIGGESWRTEASSGKSLHCVTQDGHFADELAQYADDAEAVGCPVDRRLPRYMGDAFGHNDLANTHPIYKRSGADCGLCGHKASCCGLKHAQAVYDEEIKTNPKLKSVLHPFYFLSLNATPCNANPCTFKPLTPGEFDYLANKPPFSKSYPIDRSNDCNFGQIGFPEWEEAKNHPSFPLVQELYEKFICSTVQTTKPRYNCQKDPATNQCMCCCNNNFPVNNFGKWKCVPKNQEQTETVCSHFSR